MIEKFLNYMKGRDWIVELNENQTFCLPEPMKSRYRSYPESWMSFISAVKNMENKEETAWFLCEKDYDMQGDTAWRWNEWELISLKAAENDATWIAEIKKFWDEHLPIFLSLKNGYAYYAISIKDGSVVYGTEPEFEECQTVAVSFDDFMEKVVMDKIRL